MEARLRVRPGLRWLDRYNRLTDWGADMPMPFYVLSHPVLVIIAAYVVGWDLGLWVKFMVITVLTIGITSFAIACAAAACSAWCLG